MSAARPAGNPPVIRITAATTALGLFAALFTILAAGQRSGAATTPPPSPAGAVEIHAVHGASFVPALRGQRPLFILALGSDARPGSDPSRTRSDSIHIIGINLQTHRASILGFPRDSLVPIPGFGSSKINSAMVDGGPELTVQTIENLTGIPIDFWMLTSFPELIRMVNGVGGLTVDVKAPMHDSFSGADFEPGVQRLSGREALAFARDRHDVSGGDLGRSRHQGVLMMAALTKLQKVFPKDAASLFDWMAVGWQNVRTDLPFSTLLDLAMTATQISADRVNNYIVPATTGSVGGASVVFIQSSARAVYADMAADGIIDSPPSLQPGP